MKCETGYMLVLNEDKAWGTVYSDGHATTYGWVPIEDGEILQGGYTAADPPVPTDWVYSGSPDTDKARQGTVLRIQRNTNVWFLS